jgi:hypothetical protein
MVKIGLTKLTIFKKTKFFGIRIGVIKKSRLGGGSSFNREASKGWDEDPLT